MPDEALVCVRYFVNDRHRIDELSHESDLFSTSGACAGFEIIVRLTILRLASSRRDSTF